MISNRIDSRCPQSMTVDKRDVFFVMGPKRMLGPSARFIDMHVSLVVRGSVDNR